MRSLIASIFQRLAHVINPDLDNVQPLDYSDEEYPHFEEQKPTAGAVINAILDRPIAWVDWQKLSPQERRNWGSAAREALQNRALQSIFGKSSVVNNGEATNGEYVKMVIEAIARSSRSQDETERMKHLIIGIEKMREMLEEMCIEQEVPEKVKEPYAAI